MSDKKTDKFKNWPKESHSLKRKDKKVRGRSQIIKPNSNAVVKLIYGKADQRSQRLIMQQA